MPKVKRLLPSTILDIYVKSYLLVYLFISARYLPFANRVITHFGSNFL